MIQIESEELLEFVRAKGRIALETGKLRRPFTVQLNKDELEIAVSTGKVRMHERKWLQRVCKRFSQTNSYRPTDYSELTVNASYTLAIIRAYLAEHFLPVEVYEKSLVKQIQRSKQRSPDERRKRLENAPKNPGFVWGKVKVYNRNPDVIAEVLLRAHGLCEGCERSAPFLRKTNGDPYLEVHHRKPLSEDGEDTVANAIALCPNCHRKAHHG